MREGQTNPNSIPFKKLSLPGTKLLEHTSRISPSPGASTTSLSPPTLARGDTALSSSLPMPGPGSVPIMSDNISPDSMNPAEKIGTHESKWREIQIDIRQDSPMILLRVGIIAKIPMFLQ